MEMTVTFLTTGDHDRPQMTADDHKVENGGLDIGSWYFHLTVWRIFIYLLEIIYGEGNRSK